PRGAADNMLVLQILSTPARVERIGEFNWPGRPFPKRTRNVSKNGGWRRHVKRRLPPDQKMRVTKRHDRRLDRHLCDALRRTSLHAHSWKAPQRVSGERFLDGLPLQSHEEF